MGVSMSALVEMYDDEIEEFNVSQHAKIVSIRKKRMEKENAKKIAFHNFLNMLASIAIVLIIAALFSTYIYKNSMVNEAKYDIFNLKSEIKSLNAQIEELSASIENQTELKNIEKIAMEQLNMVYPAQEQIVYIDANYHFALVDQSGELYAEPVQVVSKKPIFEQLFTALFNSNKK